MKEQKKEKNDDDKFSLLNTYSENRLEESIPVNLVELKKRKRDFKPFKKGRFIMLNQEAVTELFTKNDVTGETLKLLIFYQSIFEYGNRIKGIPQKEIAELIKMKPSQVTRAKKELINLGVIYEDGKDLYFHENFVQKGDKLK